MLKKILIPFVLFIFITSCEKESDDRTDNEFDRDYYANVFEEVWQNFDLNYPYFIHKNINWDSIKTVYEPKIMNVSSYNSFINTVLKGLLSEFPDLHVMLYDKYNYKIPLYSSEYEINYNYTDSYYERYINIDRITNSTLIYIGNIDHKIGYILIASWSDADGINELNQYLNSNQSTFEAYDAIIIDVRINGGGSELNARSVAGRFTNTSMLYAWHQYRNGPEHTDFTPYYERWFEPSADWKYSKPVYVLIGEKCMSSNESFILMMSTLDQVTTIGDTTRGSSGNPDRCVLSDGTVYFVPRWLACKTDKSILEDVGIFPDIAIDASESLSGDRDMVLERAIEEIEAIN